MANCLLTNFRVKSRRYPRAFQKRKSHAWESEFRSLAFLPRRFFRSDGKNAVAISKDTNFIVWRMSLLPQNDLEESDFDGKDPAKCEVKIRRHNMQTPSADFRRIEGEPFSGLWNPAFS
jgi:hypothetical protein